MAAPADPRAPADAPDVPASVLSRRIDLAAVLDRLPHAVLAVDAEWAVTVANARARAVLGRSAADLLGARLWELLPALAESEVGRACSQAAAAGRPQAVDGALLGLPGWYRVHAVPAPDGALVLHVRDITGERRLAAEVTTLADRDALTGLLNRRSFTERLRGTIGRLHAGAGAPAAVLLVDVDGFAAINAAQGHDAGDRVLRLVADRLAGAAREDDDALARLGADEFAVLLTGVDPESAAAVAARALATIAAPIPDEAPGGVRPPADGAPADRAADPPVRTPTSACAGLVVVDGEVDVDADAVLRHAALALQRAKASGRGQVARFTTAMHAEARARHALAEALALALDRGEFSLVYQPVVDLATGEPGSVEALLRWHHQELGSVSPATFIPMAEELGLIAPIGRWVLRTACAAIAGLAPGPGAPAAAAAPLGPAGGRRAAALSVAVNVSGHQLQGGGFADDVVAILASTGLPPGRLTIEVTETALVRDPRRARRVLGELRARGVRVALDDFGTGYSSLEYLQQLPLDVLKLDKRFVDGIAASGLGPSVGIPRAVIALGGALGLRTVAEGVETAAQRDVLRALGCWSGQGYWFARPLPLADLMAWLDAERGQGAGPGAAG